MPSTVVVHENRTLSSMFYYGSLWKLILILSLYSTCLESSGVDLRYGFVKRYEPVYYSPLDFLDNHKRIKRDVSGAEMRVHIMAKNRNFDLRLRPEEQIFHPQVIIENSDGPIHFDTNQALDGYIHREPNSRVQGVISSNGLFDGFISTEKGEEYYVETPEGSPDDTEASGIIYNTNDVDWNLISGSPSSSSCMSHRLHLKRNNESSQRKQPNSTPSSRRKRWALDAKKNTCMLYLQADHLFYARFKTEEAAINVMTSHIQRVNEIYRNTDFDQDGQPDGIQFMIKRVKVHTRNNTYDADSAYPFDGHFEVIRFLEVFSEGDYDTFCLAYMFTFRDFEGGTLGLAWTGDLNNAGGVCEKKGHFRGGIKSLNTGVITLLNYGKVVPPAVSHVTLAHEIGHNFGSPHDPENDKMCTPGGDDGNYIMFARATAGDKPNNNKFSQCSLKSIHPVLSVKARAVIHGCFSAPQKSICGNGVVEEGEECDCGWEEDCREPCCFPMRLRPRKNYEKPCHLRAGKACSPSIGPCCTGNCTLKYGDKCRDDNGCRNVAYCDGMQAVCPPSVLKPNKTVCEKGSVCFMGECTGSICLAYGLESCQCSQFPWERANKLCEVCCKAVGENQSCLSSYEWNEPPYDVPDMLAKPGTPCNNYTGYCDSHYSCQEVDPSGPLATLRKLLAADAGLATVLEWADQHWYIILTSLAMLVTLMVTLAKFCGIKAKKRLRKLTVFHSNIEAIQVQRSYVEDQNGHTVHPVAVRRKIPFKKKVRERRNRHRARIPKERRPEATATVESPQARGREIKRPDIAAPVKETPHSGKPWKRKKKDADLDPVEELILAKKIHEQARQAIVKSELSGPSLPAMPEPSPSSSGNLMKHEHEAKTVIVPHAKDARRKHRKAQVPGRRKGPRPRRPSGPVPKVKPKNLQTTSTSDEAGPSKKVQVVYKPPFSVKVEFVPKDGGESSKRKDRPTMVPGQSSSSVGSNASKVSESLLGRRKVRGSGKNNYPINPGGSELQILIPKTQEDDESTTPLPTSS